MLTILTILTIYSDLFSSDEHLLCYFDLKQLFGFSDNITTMYEIYNEAFLKSIKIFMVNSNSMLTLAVNTFPYFNELKWNFFFMGTQM